MPFSAEPVWHTEAEDVPLDPRLPVGVGSFMTVRAFKDGQHILSTRIPLYFHISEDAIARCIDRFLERAKACDRQAGSSTPARNHQ